MVFRGDLLGVKNGIYVSSLTHSDRLDHSALIRGLTRSYAQRGLPVKTCPILPGGKRADFAISLGKRWTYVEVKTRLDTGLRRRVYRSMRQEFLREVMRARAHSLKQLPRREASLVVVTTSASMDKRRAISKIAIARSMARRFFDNHSRRLLGLMIISPYRASNGSHNSTKYASAMIPNPVWNGFGESLDNLADVQL